LSSVCQDFVIPLSKLLQLCGGNTAEILPFGAKIACDRNTSFLHVFYGDIVTLAKDVLMRLVPDGA
jgi:hypothetical protein